MQNTNMYRLLACSMVICSSVEYVQAHDFLEAKQAHEIADNYGIRDASVGKQPRFVAPLDTFFKTIKGFMVVNKPSLDETAVLGYPKCYQGTYQGWVIGTANAGNAATHAQGDALLAAINADASLNVNSKKALKICLGSSFNAVTRDNIKGACDTKLAYKSELLGSYAGAYIGWREGLKNQWVKNDPTNTLGDIIQNYANNPLVVRYKDNGYFKNALIQAYGKVPKAYDFLEATSVVDIASNYGMRDAILGLPCQTILKNNVLSPITIDPAFRTVKGFNVAGDPIIPNTPAMYAQIYEPCYGGAYRGWIIGTVNAGNISRKAERDVLFEGVKQDFSSPNSKSFQDQVIVCFGGVKAIGELTTSDELRQGSRKFDPNALMKSYFGAYIGWKEGALDAQAGTKRDPTNRIFIKNNYTQSIIGKNDYNKSVLIFEYKDNPVFKNALIQAYHVAYETMKQK